MIMLNTRDVVNFRHAREAGVTTNQENVGQAPENEGRCYLITIKFPRQVPPQIRPLPRRYAHFTANV